MLPRCSIVKFQDSAVIISPRSSIFSHSIFNDMHAEIFSQAQRELLPLITRFSKEFYLVGGTAIALHIGHRRSIDFDLFTRKTLKRQQIKNIIHKHHFTIQKMLYEDVDQLHLLIHDVKLTFFHYPYSIDAVVQVDDVIRIPSLLDLAAMKALALGGRGKWKDYVDLYFLLKYHYSLTEISSRAKTIFQDSFNQKLFRQQLCYFKDIDFSESVDYMKDAISEEEVQEFLTEVATTSF